MRGIMVRAPATIAPGATLTHELIRENKTMSLLIVRTLGKSRYQRFMDIVNGAPDDLPAETEAMDPDALQEKYELKKKLQQEAHRAVKKSAKLLQKQVRPPSLAMPALAPPEQK